MYYNTIRCDTIRFCFCNTMWQVKTVLKAAAAEGVGENAIGASDKIQEAADAALADIAKAAERSDHLRR